MALFTVVHIFHVGPWIDIVRIPTTNIDGRGVRVDARLKKQKKAMFVSRIISFKSQRVNM